MDAVPGGRSRDTGRWQDLPWGRPTVHDSGAAKGRAVVKLGIDPARMVRTMGKINLIFFSTKNSGEKLGKNEIYHGNCDRMEII